MNERLRALVGLANERSMARAHEGHIYGDVPHVPDELQSMNHPNRNRNSEGARPSPAEIREARHRAGLTAEQAGALIHERAIRWVRFEQGEAFMHPASWELFQLKVGQK